MYVAEHHETLRHVLVFIALAGTSNNTSTTSTGILSAEVLPSTSSGTSGDWLLLRLSGTPSPPLTLPVSVTPGVKDVVGRNSHWEVKLSCTQPPQQPFGIANGSQTNVASESDDPPLLTASQLNSLLPTSYTCASCLLPLVSVVPTRYSDLPSEYWEELVEAWMCHPDGQILAKGRMHMHAEAGKGGHGFGFWPTQGEALVGGSYVLFEGSAIVEGNVVEVVGSEVCRFCCFPFCIPSVDDQEDRRRSSTGEPRFSGWSPCWFWSGKRRDFSVDTSRPKVNCNSQQTLFATDSAMGATPESTFHFLFLFLTPVLETIY